MLRKLNGWLANCYYRFMNFRDENLFLVDAFFAFLVVVWFGLLILFWVQFVLRR